MDHETMDRVAVAYEAAASESAFHMRIAAEDISIAHTTPHAVMRPRIYIDGDRWCALYGDNIQDGVAGFGTSPAEAMADFDERWGRSLEVDHGD